MSVSRTTRAKIVRPISPDHFTHDQARCVRDAAASCRELRNLCVKTGIPVEANGKPVKATVMNDELKKAAVYDEAQRKHVAAWQGIRNDAAHAKPEFRKQTPATITLMIASIRDFITRHRL